MIEVQTDKRRKNGLATKERMLAAAELLFAERGFDGASTRALVDAAGAEIAMIVYHFGSKLGLYREVLMRRAERLNALRLRELDEVLGRAKGRPELVAVVHALVASNIRLRTDPELGGLPVARLIARELIDPAQAARHTIGDMFDQLAQRFVGAIKLALPEASDEAVYWGYHFAISAMVQTMANSGRLEALSKDVCDMTDGEAVVDRLVAFIVGGIQACVAAAQPATERPKATSRTVKPRARAKAGGSKASINHRRPG